MPSPPPKKQKNQAQNRRCIDGELLDVKACAQFLGPSEHTVRARVRRREIPFRRLGGRIVFIRKELELFLSNLEGCSVKEATNNLEAKKR